MNNQANICDVVLRDGIQKEPEFIRTDDKIKLLDALQSAGLHSIETTSFVNPKVIPQLADAEQIVAHSKSLTNISPHVLIINQKGFDRVVQNGVKAIALVATCSETFSEKNNRMSVAETRKVILDILSQAKAAKLWCRLYMTTAWVCPYEGKIPEAKVLKELEQFLPSSPDQIVLADTIGHAAPNEVKSLLLQATTLVARSEIFLHLHDTKAFGLANVLAALDCGITGFDSALGGVGGCPFAPGAAGNLATEDLVFFLKELGIETGIDLDKLWKGVTLLETILGRPIGGRTKQFYLSRKKPCSI